MASDIDWAALNSKLPIEKTDEGRTRRKEISRGMDRNGNGYLSLSEVKNLFF